ncbi:STAS domain-containing protein [Lentzea sp.]|uniref:STAS domain-containing protein n=1 Tax=Lentzea sp. TaxID=56099 RepID=UPI002ED2D4D7
MAAVNFALAAHDGVQWLIVLGALDIAGGLYLERRVRRGTGQHPGSGPTHSSDLLLPVPRTPGDLRRTTDVPEPSATPGSLVHVQVGPHCMVSVHNGPVTGVGVVQLGGEIDTCTTGELWPVVEAEAGRAERALVVQLSEVTFFGSAGITLLLDAWQAARGQGVGFAVAAGQAAVLRPLRITQVDELLPVRADLAGAVAAALPAR